MTEGNPIAAAFGIAAAVTLIAIIGAQIAALVFG